MQPIRIKYNGGTHLASEAVNAVMGRPSFKLWPSYCYLCIVYKAFECLMVKKYRGRN